MPVLRSVVAARTVPLPTAPDHLNVTVRELAAHLVSIERSPSGPAVDAFRAAIYCCCQNLVNILGPAVLAQALARVWPTDPERADDRKAVITAAWTVLVA